MSTRLLIDGYNLLFASGVFASAAGPPTLQRTRDALLQFLAESLDPKLRGRTIVVFDATQAPPGLPGEQTVADMQVRFSRRGQDADELLEELIAAHRAPRELLVVSSDHRIQRAARQRGATFSDSDLWLRELQRASQADSTPTKPDDPLVSSAELQRWLAEFGDVDSRRLTPSDPVPHKPPAPQPSEITRPQTKPHKSQPAKQAGNTGDTEKPSRLSNPFPPGYAEDLLDEDKK